MFTGQYKEVLPHIISKAQNGEQSKFHFIRTWQDYRFHKKHLQALKYLKSSLAYSTKKAFKRYCKSVAAGTSEVTDLLIYTTLVETIKYYQTEIEVITDIIYEYEAYVFEGHLIDAWSGKWRPWEDLKDFREVKK